MIIKFNGTLTKEQLIEHIDTLVSDVLVRAGMTTDDLHIALRDVQLGVLFSADTANPQYLTVEHDGVPEIFELNVKLKDNGDIERRKDNEKESFKDDFTRAVAKGEGSPITQEIESVFKDEELEEVNTVDAGDLQEVHYNLKDTEDEVVRYYRNGVLVGEALLKRNEGY